MWIQQLKENRALLHPYPAVINSLTSLRFVAAAWVVFFHFKNFFPDSAIDNSPIAIYGFLGVDFFFVLSGFVLTHVYLPKMRAAAFDYWGFLVKRIARVYPLHVLTLIATLVLSVMAARAGVNYTIWDLGGWTALDKGQIIRGLFANLTLIHAWGSTQGLMFNLPSWSISAEWFAYLLFPVFVLLVRPLLNRPAAMLVVSVAVLVIMDVLITGLSNNALLKSTWNIGALRITPSFVIGIALYRFFEHYSLGEKAVMWALFGAVALLIASTMVSAPFVVIVLLLAAIVGLSADAERYGKLRPLQKKFPVLLGEISYSVYLWHFPIGVLCFDVLLKDREILGGGALVGPALILAVLAVVTFISWLSYKWVEVPARRAIIARAQKIELQASSGE